MAELMNGAVDEKIDGWINDYIVSNGYGISGYTPKALDERSSIMLMLRTGKEILKYNESKLPFLAKILQELIGKIQNVNLRCQILKCLLSAKLKIALQKWDVFWNVKDTGTVEERSLLKELFQFEEAFLSRLTQWEKDEVQQQVSCFEKLILEHYEEVREIHGNEGARKMCIEEFDEMVKGVVEELGKSFLEKIAETIAGVFADKAASETATKPVSDTTRIAMAVPPGEKKNRKNEYLCKDVKKTKKPDRQKNHKLVDVRLRKGKYELQQEKLSRRHRKYLNKEKTERYNIERSSKNTERNNNNQKEDGVINDKGERRRKKARGKGGEEIQQSVNEKIRNYGMLSTESSSSGFFENTEMATFSNERSEFAFKNSAITRRKTDRFSNCKDSSTSRQIRHAKNTITNVKNAGVRAENSTFVRQNKLQGKNEESERKMLSRNNLLCDLLADEPGPVTTRQINRETYSNRFVDVLSLESDNESNTEETATRESSRVYYKEYGEKASGSSGLDLCTTVTHVKSCLLVKMDGDKGFASNRAYKNDKMKSSFTESTSHAADYCFGNEVAWTTDEIELTERSCDRFGDNSSETTPVYGLNDLGIPRDRRRRGRKKRTDILCTESYSDTSSGIDHHNVKQMNLLIEDADESLKDNQKAMDVQRTNNCLLVAANENSEKTLSNNRPISKYFSHEATISTATAFDMSNQDFMEIVNDKGESLYNCALQSSVQKEPAEFCEQNDVNSTALSTPVVETINLIGADGDKNSKNHKMNGDRNGASSRVAAMKEGCLISGQGPSLIGAEDNFENNLKKEKVFERRKKFSVHGGILLCDDSCKNNSKKSKYVQHFKSSGRQFVGRIDEHNANDDKDNDEDDEQDGHDDDNEISNLNMAIKWQIDEENTPALAESCDEEDQSFLEIHDDVLLTPISDEIICTEDKPSEVIVFPDRQKDGSLFGVYRTDILNDDEEDISSIGMPSSRPRSSTPKAFVASKFDRPNVFGRTARSLLSSIERVTGDKENTLANYSDSIDHDLYEESINDGQDRSIEMLKEIKKKLLKLDTLIKDFGESNGVKNHSGKVSGIKRRQSQNAEIRTVELDGSNLLSSKFENAFTSSIHRGYSYENREEKNLNLLKGRKNRNSRRKSKLNDQQCSACEDEKLEDAKHEYGSNYENEADVDDVRNYCHSNNSLFLKRRKGETMMACITENRKEKGEIIDLTRSRNSGSISSENDSYEDDSNPGNSISIFKTDLNT